MSQSFKETFSRLFKLVSETEFTNNGEARLTRDLQRISDRILHREYEETDFVGNTFNVPDRTREFYDNLNGYYRHVQTWERILGVLQLNSIPQIIDLCPGWAPKLSLALWYAGYSGELLLLDKDEESMSALVQFMQIFKPRYRITPVCTDLLRNVPHLKAKLVLANHIADDMALELAQKRFCYSVSELYETEGAFKKIWEDILDNPENLIDETAARLVNIMSTLVTDGGSAFFTQYTAYMERLLELDPVVTFSKKIVEKAVVMLCEMGFVREYKLIEDAFEGFSGVFASNDCWLIRRQAFTGCKTP